MKKTFMVVGLLGLMSGSFSFTMDESDKKEKLSNRKHSRKKTRRKHSGAKRVPSRKKTQQVKSIKEYAKMVRKNRVEKGKTVKMAPRALAQFSLIKELGVKPEEIDTHHALDMLTKRIEEQGEDAIDLLTSEAQRKIRKHGGDLSKLLAIGLESGKALGKELLNDVLVDHHVDQQFIIEKAEQELEKALQKCCV